MVVVANKMPVITNSVAELSVTKEIYYLANCIAKIEKALPVERASGWKAGF
jgi:hypothetical protein